mgnify:CR=1 FL=1
MHIIIIIFLTNNSVGVIDSVYNSIKIRSLGRRVKWEEIGFEVVGEAENGADALELVEKLEPDLLLTDIKMPFLSGIELARAVREVRPMVQIAFLSGFDDFTYAQQAIQYNIVSYMLKPISAKEIEAELIKIKKAMDQRVDKRKKREAGHPQDAIPYSAFARQLSE